MPVLASEELAADKTLALFGRAAARDYVDVFVLARKFGRERFLQLAAEKDRGFSPVIYAETVGRIDRLPRTDFDVDDATLAEMKAAFASWADELLRSR